MLPVPTAARAYTETVACVPTRMRINRMRTWCIDILNPACADLLGRRAEEEESTRISSCGRLKGKYFFLGGPAVESLSLLCMILHNSLSGYTGPWTRLLWKRGRDAWPASSAWTRNLRNDVRQDMTFTQPPAKKRPSRQEKTFTQPSAKKRPSRNFPTRPSRDCPTRPSRDCPLLW